MERDIERTDRLLDDIAAESGFANVRLMIQRCNTDIEFVHVMDRLGIRTPELDGVLIAAIELREKCRDLLEEK